MDSIKEILEKTLYIHWDRYAMEHAIGGIDGVVKLIEEHFKQRAEDLKQCCTPERVCPMWREVEDESGCVCLCPCMPSIEDFQHIASGQYADWRDE